MSEPDLTAAPTPAPEPNGTRALRSLNYAQSGLSGPLRSAIEHAFPTGPAPVALSNDALLHSVGVLSEVEATLRVLGRVLRAEAADRAFDRNQLVRAEVAQLPGSPVRYCPTCGLYEHPGYPCRSTGRPVPARVVPVPPSVVPSPPRVVPPGRHGNGGTVTTSTVTVTTGGPAPNPLEVRAAVIAGLGRDQVRRA